MDVRRLGMTGCALSSVSLGTLTWGHETPPSEARKMLNRYLDAGGTTVDTATWFGQGEAVRVLGDLLRAGVDRRDLTLCVKSGVRRDRFFHGIDASRGWLTRDLDDTLSALGVSDVDVWMVQAWDPQVPLHEIAATLSWALDTGRCRYVGVSNYQPWQASALAAMLPHTHAGTHLAVHQIEGSLAHAGEISSAANAADFLGYGVMLWAALGRGWLTRMNPHDGGRGPGSRLSGYAERPLTDDTERLMKAVAGVADGLGASMAQVALVWARDIAGVSSVVVGPRTEDQLAELLEADIVIDGDLRSALDEVALPE